MKRDRSDHHSQLVHARRRVYARRAVHSDNARMRVTMPARVFVLTLSGRDEAARRELIRGSWGTRGSLPPTRGSDFDVGHAFFVGNRTCLLPEAARQYDIDCSSQSAGQPEREQSALLREVDIHGDVVLLPTIDGYYRGLLPKYKRAFAWVVQFTSAQWVLKADTDLFARPLATARWVSALDSTRMSVFGWIWGHDRIPAEPCRKCGKAGLQARHLLMLRGLARWPPYPVGSAGYLLSRPVATFIAEHDGDELPATDISLGLWLSHSKKPVRLINAPEAFVRAGDGKACIRKPEALVCCHGSMGPRNMQRCGNSSWTAMPAVEAEMSALPQCRSKLPAPLDSRCRLGSGGERSRGPRGV